MKGDFTRDTFDIANHFSRVLMQQGRVQLDADWNEQAAILLHYIQTLARDLIGPFGGPAIDSGFAMTPPKAEDKLDIGDFHIGKGRYYVDGLLCEVDAATTFAKQAFWPDARNHLLKGGTYLLYLDVWEQHVSALEQQVERGAGGMRESALGGPDTCSRARVVWQVKWANKRPDGSDLGDLTCDDFRRNWQDWVDGWQACNRGRLRAGLETTAPSKNPCITDPESRYRGQENQLYRVEIHRGGVARSTGGDNVPKGGQAQAAEGYATFKWSRDNGSVLASVADKQGATLTLNCARGFEPNVWVELLRQSDALNGMVGVLRRIATVDGDAITLDTQDNTQPLPSAIDFVRRWDQRPRGDVVLADDNAVPIVEGEPIALENGIEVTFEPSAQNEPAAYRAGDYWLIPARVATGDIEWPTEPKPGKPDEWQPKALTPRGITHHFAPLAVVAMGNDKVITVASDCRCAMNSAEMCQPPGNA